MNKRIWIPILIFVVILLGIMGRLVYLTYIDKGFLRGHANQEMTRLKTLPARRGTIYDRNGVALAVSTPMSNIIFDPKQMLEYKKYWPKLAESKVLGMSLQQIEHLVYKNPKSQFMYVKKGLPPQKAAKLAKMHIPGIYIKNAPETFYPLGPVTAKIIGFTNVKNEGQDGLEYVYNKRLKATPGKALVTTNALGQILSIQKVIRPPKPGHNIYLSIDSRLQYAAYKALKTKIEADHATSGSVVVVDPKTGEILTAVSYPSFNPNNFNDRRGPYVRARTITDFFEPGSTAKVVTLSVALDSGKYTPFTPINTSPGYYYIHGNRIRDDGDYGMLDVTSVLTKSSNVGASKIALSLPHHDVYNRFISMGIGQPTGLTFPGQTLGIIHPYDRVGTFEFATMSFGYAIAASLVQMGRMYSAIADNGIIRQLSLLKTKTPNPGKSIMKAKTAHELIKMLQTVVGYSGTGLLANIPGYNVAGKTGTAHKVGPHGFYKHRYNGLFIGMVPANNPRVLIAVRVNDAKGHYQGYGGVAAAPVFAKVAKAAMRLLNVAPTQHKINETLFKNQKRFIKAIVDA